MWHRPSPPVRQSQGGLVLAVLHRLCKGSCQPPSPVSQGGHGGPAENSPLQCRVAAHGWEGAGTCPHLPGAGPHLLGCNSRISFCNAFSCLFQCQLFLSPFFVQVSFAMQPTPRRQLHIHLLRATNVSGAEAGRPLYMELRSPPRWSRPCVSRG